MILTWGNEVQYVGGVHPLILGFGASGAIVTPPSQRGNIDYDQIRAAARQGDGNQFCMAGPSSPVAGHVPVYDAQHNLVDSGGGPGGSGTVTSVALTMPSDFTVGGSPVTGAGTLAVTGGATKSAIQQQAYLYGMDTGGANAYAVTLSPAPTLVAGSKVVFIAANACTGASTLAINGGSAIAIKKNGNSTALASGDIVANEIITATYDGTVFQIIVAGSGRQRRCQQLHRRWHDPQQLRLDWCRNGDAGDGGGE